MHQHYFFQHYFYSYLSTSTSHSYWTYLYYRYYAGLCTLFTLQSNRGLTAYRVPDVSTPSVYNHVDIILLLYCMYVTDESNKIK